MATVLFEGVFDQILLKAAKSDLFLAHFSNFSPLPPLHFLNNWIFLTFNRFLIYQTWISKGLAGLG